MFFAAPTRFLQAAVKKESGGLLWKKIKFTCTRRANSKKRLRRVQQNESVLRACAGLPPEGVTPPLESKKKIMAKGISVKEMSILNHLDSFCMQYEENCLSYMLGLCILLFYMQLFLRACL